jgi:hypothetical protein
MKKAILEKLARGKKKFNDENPTQIYLKHFVCVSTIRDPRPGADLPFHICGTFR